MERFGDRIMRLRGRLSQEELGMVSGLGARTIRAYEKMERPPSGIRLKSLEDLARGLDVPIDVLLHGEEEYAAALRRGWREDLAEVERRLDERLKRAGL